MAVLEIEVSICEELNFARGKCPQTSLSHSKHKENVNYTEAGIISAGLTTVAMHSKHAGHSINISGPCLHCPANGGPRAGHCQLSPSAQPP